MPYMLHALQRLGQDTTLREQGSSYQHLRTLASRLQDYNNLRCRGVLCDDTFYKFDQLIKTTLGDAHQRRKDKLFHRHGWQKDK